MIKKRNQKKTRGATPKLSETEIRDRIRQEAYSLYLKKGKDASQELSNWLEAEKTVIEQYQAQ